MNIRLEGTKEEIRKLENVIQFGMKVTNNAKLKIKSISKFYPNRVNREFVNAPVNGMGRVYIEVN